MGEKMSLQQVRDWAANTPASNGWQAKERDEAVAALDAHLTQPAQAVDVGAEWRPFYASVIQSLAVLARARTTDDGPREAILRDTVMGEVVRIRAALDRFSKTMRTAALPNANGKEGCPHEWEQVTTSGGVMDRCSACGKHRWHDARGAQ